MVRKLKYHEQKLLKKVDFITWQSDNNLHEVRVLRKYHIQKREDYVKLVCVLILKCETLISALPKKNLNLGLQFRVYIQLESL